MPLQAPPNTHRAWPPQPCLPSAPALRPHLEMAVLQDTPRTQLDGALQQAVDHRAPSPQ